MALHPQRTRTRAPRSPLLQQPGFPDTRLPVDEADTAYTAASALHDCVSAASSATRPTNGDRAPTDSAESSRKARSRYSSTGFEASQLEWPAVCGVSSPLDGCKTAIGQIHRIGFSCRLHPLGEIDFVAVELAIDSSALSHDGDGHFGAIDTDANLRFVARQGRVTIEGRRNLRDDAEACSACAQRVIGLSDRRTEDREHAIPLRSDDRPAGSNDGPCHRVRCALIEFHREFGRKVGNHGRRTDHVAEHHRYRLERPIG